MRKLLDKPNYKVKRTKKDRELFETLSIAEIMEMPFAGQQTRRREYKPEVMEAPEGMVKLQPKEGLEKLSRGERLEQQEKREKELDSLLKKK